jgi:hypothetical protein
MRRINTVRFENVSHVVHGWAKKDPRSFEHMIPLAKLHALARFDEMHRMTNNDSDGSSKDEWLDFRTKENQSN